jgi:DNA-binding NarL/FixJ family response regulator
LRAQADTLAHRAYKLRQKAEQLEAIEEQRAHAREVQRIVAQHCADAALRDTPEALAEALRAELAELMPWMTVEIAATLMRAEFARRTSYARAMRDREIMRCARLGWSNAEIGAQFALHPKSVSRVVQRVLKQCR